MGRNLSYKAGREHAKILLKSLLSFVETEQEESNDCRANWQKGTELWVTHSTLTGLAELTRKYSQSLSTEEIRNALSCLIALEIVEDTRAKNIPKTTTNSEVWSFVLKFNSIDTQTNLNWLFSDNGEWNKRRQAQKTKSSKVSKSKIPKEQGEDWQDICRTMLEKHKRLTTDEMLYADEENKFELNKIHVPLALVERTKPEKRRGDILPEEGSRLYKPSYEEKQQFKHEDFLTQVLRDGVGKTKGRRIALIGEPGAGKTTLLQTIAFWILDQNQDLPIWISLADLQSKNIEEYLLQNWLKNALEVTRVKPEQEDSLAELFKKNKVCLLLDGADEISSQKPLEEIGKQLEGWVKNARVVLSCRLNVWEANTNALHDFETYRLRDFDYPEQVKQFIDNWFKPKTSQAASKSNADTGGHKGERLWDELNQPERQRIQDLVKNPLRLALLCAIWHSSAQGFPKTKAGFYYLFIKRFYTWKENKFPTNEEQQKELNKVLSRLAKRAIDQDTSRFRLQHELLTEELGDSKQEGSNFWLALRLGWLNKVGLAVESDTEEEVYAFYHPTFQEYFAALAIDNWDSFLNHVPENPSDCNANYRIFEPQWKEVILLWLGREDILNKDKENFIKALVDFKDGCGEWINIDKVTKGFYEFKAYFLAAQGITEFKDFSLSNEVVKQIVRYSFGYLNTKTLAQRESFLNEIRNEALDILTTTNTTKAIEGLIAVIHDSQIDSDTLWWAVESLEEIDPGNQTAIEGLIAVIRHPQVDSYTLYRAASRLKKIDPGNRIAIEGLIAVIRHPQVDSYNLSDALHSLREIGVDNQTAIEGLIAVMRDPQVYIDGDNFIFMVEILEKIGVGNKTAIERLIAIIRDPQVDSYTLYWAASSLGKIDPCNQTAIERLIAVIRDPQVDSDLRWLAAYNLGEIGVGNQTAIERLIAVIRDPQVHSDTLYEVVESLNEIGVGNQTAIEGLIAVIRDPQVKTYSRRWATYSLGKIDSGNRTAIEGLIAVIRDPQVKTYSRRWAASRLKEIDPGNQIVIEGLIAVIRDPQADSYIRRLAASELEEIDPGNQTAIEGLIAVIRDPQVDSDTLYRAASSLEKIDPGNQTAIEGLIAVIRDPQVDSDIYWLAIYNLGKIGVGNQTAIEELIAVIRDPQVGSYIRKLAASRLEKIDPGNQIVIEGLIAVIRDPQVDSETCGEALGRLEEIDSGNQAAIERLITVIRDPQVNSDTRMIVAERLGEIVENRHMVYVVSVLKNCLSYETYKNNFDLFNTCYSIIWNYAKEMTYPKFYDAWFKSIS